MSIRIRRQLPAVAKTPSAIIDGHALFDAPGKAPKQPAPRRKPPRPSGPPPSGARSRPPAPDRRAPEARPSSDTVVKSQIRLARDVEALRAEVAQLRAEIVALQNGLPAFGRGAA